EVPLGTRRLGVAGRVGRAGAELVLPRLGVPAIGPATPGELRDRRVELCVGPALAGVRADLDPLDDAVARPRAPLEDARPRGDKPAPREKLRDPRWHHQRA